MPTIIAAIDFSDASALVIESAARQSRDGTILLIHVAPEDPDYVSYRVGPEDERDSIAAQLRTLRASLLEEASQLTTQGHYVETRLIQGDPASRIVEEASRHDAGLIIVGRHRHSLLHDRLFGSVAEAVLRSAICPVLVVPRADSEGAPPA